jgi:hypothetical protein
MTGEPQAAPCRAGALLVFDLARLEDPPMDGLMILYSTSPRARQRAQVAETSAK